jgi:hypothetical protein
MESPRTSDEWWIYLRRTWATHDALMERWRKGTDNDKMEIVRRRAG